ncbi:MAG: condensation domain-containing protein, partial [Actinocatenispora sp.]
MTQPHPHATTAPEADAQRFWTGYLAGTTRTPLPGGLTAGHPPERRTVERAVRRVELSAALTRSLAELARATDATPTAVLRAAWALLLGRYAGADTVTFG